MAKYSGANVAAILVGGYDLLADTTEIPSIDVEALFEESTCLGDSWAEHLPVGVRKGYWSQRGFFDDAAAKLNAITAEIQGTSRVVAILHEGNAVGKQFIGMSGAYSAKYNRVLTRGALHKANVDYTVSGEVEMNGVILQELEAKTADWDTDAESVDNGASSANGGAGYLQITAFSGFSGFVGKIRHSVDDVTYVDLVTFANATAIGAQRVAVTGTVNRHLLFDGNVTGSGSITVMAGFARNA